MTKADALKQLVPLFLQSKKLGKSINFEHLNYSYINTRGKTGI